VPYCAPRPCYFCQFAAFKTLITVCAGGQGSATTVGVHARRDFLTKLASIAVWGFYGGAVAGASEICESMGPRWSRCTVGIPAEGLFAGARQESREWCWAACIEMVFGYYGHRVSQSRIVKETWGGLVDKPVHERELLADLNRNWTDNRGRRFRSNAYVFDRPAAGVSDLRRCQPLILGTPGHTVVLTAITLEIDNFSRRWNIAEAIVCDPWPGHGARMLSSEEWRNIRFAVRVELHDV
jgi:Papain-like cysteine protease AvrRpt2